MAQFTNQAQLTYRGRVVSSNVAIGEIAETLTVTKTAVHNVYEYNSHVSYLINIINLSPRDVTGLTVTDDLGAYTMQTQTLTPLSYTRGALKFYSNSTNKSYYDQCVTVGID